jgi:YD repeat-containing protein
MNSLTERDRLGRVVGQKFEKNNRYVKEKSYLWASNDRLLQIITDGKIKRFDYDGWGNLSKTIFEDGSTEHRNPDWSGNLFERLDRKDRKYERGGQLLKTENWEYKYDKEGKTFKLDKHRTPVYKKAYLKDSDNVIFSHNHFPDDHIHKTNPHINILTSEGKKVSIIITK